MATSRAAAKPPSPLPREPMGLASGFKITAGAIFGMRDASAGALLGRSAAGRDPTSAMSFQQPLAAVLGISYIEGRPQGASGSRALRGARHLFQAALWYRQAPKVCSRGPHCPQDTKRPGCCVVALHTRLIW